jgi:hypothetical protein
MKNIQLTKIVGEIGTAATTGPAPLLEAAQSKDRVPVVLQLLSLEFLKKEAAKAGGRTSSSANITR